MTRNHEYLIENGWRRIYYGWWNDDLGREPKKGVSMTIATLSENRRQKTGHLEL